MFSSFAKDFGTARMAGKVVNILLKSYSLSAEPEDVMTVVSRFPSINDEFEMTLIYLTDWVGRMYVDHPKAKSEVSKYIHITNELGSRGYIKNISRADALFKAIEIRFSTVEQSSGQEIGNKLDSKPDPSAYLKYYQAMSSYLTDAASSALGFHSIRAQIWVSEQYPPDFCSPSALVGYRLNLPIEVSAAFVVGFISSNFVNDNGGFSSPSVADEKSEIAQHISMLIHFDSILEKHEGTDIHKRFSNELTAHFQSAQTQRQN